jgi:hypothetical protein
LSIVVTALSMILSTILKIRRGVANFNKKETQGGAP